jgi:hypothetical protein
MARIYLRSTIAWLNENGAEDNYDKAIQTAAFRRFVFMPDGRTTECSTPGRFRGNVSGQ